MLVVLVAGPFLIRVLFAGIVTLPFVLVVLVGAYFALLAALNIPTVWARAHGDIALMSRVRTVLAALVTAGCLAIGAVAGNAVALVSLLLAYALSALMTALYCSRRRSLRSH